MNSSLLKTVYAYIIISLVLIFLDSLWLSVLAKQFYIDKLSTLIQVNQGHIHFSLTAAMVAYFALVTGLVFFVLPLGRRSLCHVVVYGALFGFVICATYDFTNLAVLKAWRWEVAIVDTLWGMFLCASASLIAAYFLRFFD